MQSLLSVFYRMHNGYGTQSGRCINLSISSSFEAFTVSRISSNRGRSSSLSDNGSRDQLSHFLQGTVAEPKYTDKYVFIVLTPRFAPGGQTRVDSVPVGVPTGAFHNHHSRLCFPAKAFVSVNQPSGRRILLSHHGWVNG